MAREKVLCGKEEIIRAAVRIVDSEGMEALSARRISKELGVSAMTIYNYVENLAEVKKYVLSDGFDRLYDSIYHALNELRGQVDKVKFCKVNVDEQPNLASMFGIDSIPTLAVVQDRHTLTGMVGVHDKADIKAMLEKCKA